MAGTETERIIQSPAYGAGPPCSSSPSTKARKPREWRQYRCSPSTPTARRSAEYFNHYSLLRTTEDLLGPVLLGRAETAEDMAKSFGL